MGESPQTPIKVSAHRHKLAVSVRQNWLQILHKLLALNTMAKFHRPYMNVAHTKTIKLFLRCQHSIERSHTVTMDQAMIT